jgi:hypothetical protein
MSRIVNALRLALIPSFSPLRRIKSLGWQWHLLCVHIAIAPARARRSVYDTAFQWLSQPQEVLMSIINVLIIGALIATVVVLTLGLRSMARGGTYDKEHAEKFMWERVALQLLVVILLVAAVVLSNT